MTLRKLLPLSGVAFVALIAVCVPLGGSTPASTAPGAEVASYYDSHQARLVAVSFLFTAAAFFVVLFASTLVDSLAPAGERTRTVWGRVLLGGAIVFAATVGLVAALNFALVDSPAKVSEPALQALNLLLNDGWVLWNPALGVFMLGVAGAWSTSGLARRWPGRVALVLGVALFVPFADFFAFLASGLWIVGVSVALYRGSGQRVYAPAAGLAS